VESADISDVVHELWLFVVRSTFDPLRPWAMENYKIVGTFSSTIKDTPFVRKSKGQYLTCCNATAVRNAEIMQNQREESLLRDS
jgi:hypothetical protein